MARNKQSADNTSLLAEKVDDILDQEGLGDAPLFKLAALGRAIGAVAMAGRDMGNSLLSVTLATARETAQTNATPFLGLPLWVAPPPGEIDDEDEKVWHSAGAAVLTYLAENAPFRELEHAVAMAAVGGRIAGMTSDPTRFIDLMFEHAHETIERGTTRREVPVDRPPALAVKPSNKPKPTWLTHVTLNNGKSSRTSSRAANRLLIDHLLPLLDAGGGVIPGMDPWAMQPAFPMHDPGPNEPMVKMPGGAMFEIFDIGRPRNYAVFTGIVCWQPERAEQMMQLVHAQYTRMPDTAKVLLIDGPGFRPAPQQPPPLPWLMSFKRVAYEFQDTRAVPFGSIERSIAWALIER